MNKIGKLFKQTVIEKNKGQATLTFVLAVLASGLILVGALSVLTFNEVQKLNNTVKSAQSYYAAEAGVEDAILRTKTNMNYSNSYTLDVAGATTTVTISGPPNNLEIISEGEQQNRIRKIGVNLSTTTGSSGSVVNFNYGVQVGAGGLEMDNNSGVDGNIYSNNTILGGNGAEITGSAIAVTRINNVGVGIDAWSDDIDNSDVTGNLYCQTGSGNNKSCNTSQGIPTVEPLPISDSDISGWKADAEAGGIHSGDFLVTNGGSATIGPVKITGNLLVDNNATLTLTGTIWVVGDITISNNVTVKLSAAYGDDSGMIIGDNKINVSNNAAFQGSGDPDSHIMILNAKDSTGEETITVDNNSEGVVYYAHKSWIKFNNNATAKEATGYGIRLDNNAIITYDTGLANVNFISGPGGSFEIKSWQEII